MELKNIEQITAERQRFVLVVESSDRNRLFLSTLLLQFGYAPYAVGTAKEAVDIVTVLKPVLIVTAGQIDADCNAVRLIKSIKSANPECTAPFIVIIAQPEPAFERECLGAGALTCLRAPVTFENFYRTIQIAVEPIPRMTIRISTDDLPAAINGKRQDEFVQELSEGGIYIRTSSLHPRDTKLQVKIKFPDCVISSDAVVIYAKRSDEVKKGRTGMGLQLVGLSEEDQKRIRLFIRREMSKGIKPAPPAR